MSYILGPFAVLLWPILYPMGKAKDCFMWAMNKIKPKNPILRFFWWIMVIWTLIPLTWTTLFTYLGAVAMGNKEEADVVLANTVAFFHTVFEIAIAWIKFLV